MSSLFITVTNAVPAFFLDNRLRLSLDGKLKDQTHLQHILLHDHLSHLLQILHVPRAAHEATAEPFQIPISCMRNEVHTGVGGKRWCINEDVLVSVRNSGRGERGGAAAWM